MAGIDIGLAVAHNRVMSDTAVTIPAKASQIVPGDIVFLTAYAPNQLVDEVEVDEKWGGVWVTWHNGERDSFPLDYTLYLVVEA